MMVASSFIETVQRAPILKDISRIFQTSSASSAALIVAFLVVVAFLTVFALNAVGINLFGSKTTIDLSHYKDGEKYLAEGMQVRRPAKCNLGFGWLPWIGCAVEIGTNPDRYLAKANKAFGPVYRVTVAGRDMILVTSPDIITHIYKQPKLFSFGKIRREMQVSVFGQAKELDGDYFEEEVFPMHSRLFSPKAIEPLVADYATHFEAEIEAKKTMMMQNAAGEQVVRSQQLLYEMVYNASAKALNGPTFPPISENLDFLHFDKGFPVLAGRLPDFVAKPFVKSRERAIGVIAKWVKTVIDDPSIPVGHIPRYLLDYFRERDLSNRDLACIVLMDTWALAANAPQAAVWAIVRFAEHPTAIDRLRKETAAALELCDGDISKVLHDQALLASDTFAFTTSAINETLREATSVLSMRRVKENAIIPVPGTSEGIAVKAGEELYCLSRTVHTDTEAYHDPYNWDPERYLPERRKAEKKVQHDHMPWGGGVSICDGRHFAMQELRILLIGFFHHFDTETVNPPAVVEHSRGIGMGVMWVPEKHRLRVKVRASSGGDSGTTR